MTTEENPPQFVRLYKIIAGQVRLGLWHDLVPSSWTVKQARGECGVRGQQMRWDYAATDTDVPTGAKFCPRCSAIRRDRAKAGKRESSAPATD